jgi:hypothetical protein
MKELQDFKKKMAEQKNASKEVKPKEEVKETLPALPSIAPPQREVC